MNDSIGDILYIVVMIAVLIFSIYRKVKGGQDDTVMPERDVDDNLDEVFPPFGGQRGDYVKPAEVIMKHPLKPVRVVPTRQVKYQRIDFQRMQKSDAIKKFDRTKRISTSTIQRKSTKEPEYVLKYYWDEKPLDLQAAIIYSEVIKRPDY